MAVVLILVNSNILGAIFIISLNAIFVIIVDALGLVGVLMTRAGASGQLDIEGAGWRRSRHNIVKEGYT